MIKPTVGRVLWFTPKGHPKGAQKLKADIALVHSDDCINIGYLDPCGMSLSMTSVHLVQPGEDVLDDGPYCGWMPYQQKKDHGSESGEAAVGTQGISGNDSWTPPQPE